MADKYEIPYYQTCCGDEDEGLLSLKHYAGQHEAAKATAIQRFTSEEELNRNLAPYLPGLEEALTHTHTQPLEDTIFPRIAELLTFHGKGEWSLRPRTYAVLKMLGRPELLDDFIKEGRYDKALPYTAGNLPDAVKGAELRNRFLRLQGLVACQESDIAALEEGGKHLYLSRPGDEYFTSRIPLGEPGMRGSRVERVISLRSARPYARKTLRRGLSTGTDAEIVSLFEKEVQVLKRLNHEHIIKLVGSYSDEKTVGLIVTPVADCNLEEFLRDPYTDPIICKRRLRPFFGCLTTALAYLHSRRVLHNDIKPKNVLIRGFSIYLADFGISHTWNAGQNSTTDGDHKFCTKQYCPPELLRGDQGRNKASDIWSLGLVFLDMATILADRTLNVRDSFFMTHGTEQKSCFAQNMDSVLLWAEQLRSQSNMSTSDLKILGWTSRMLQSNGDDRPTAEQLRGNIIDDSQEYLYICDNCSSSAGIEGNEDPNSSRDQPAPVTAASLGRQERPSSAETDIGNSGLSTKKFDVSKSSADPSETRDLPGSSGMDTSQPQYSTEDGQGARAQFIQPTPLRSPPFLRKDGVPLPAATMAPSYVLAGTNHPSRTQLDEAQTYNPLGCNLFVYGRLMFPGVLQAIAFTSTKGVYSRKLRRRLYPSSGDWARADLSIKSACDAMIPARLNGYDRWRPKGFNCAAIQEARLTSKILEKNSHQGDGVAKSHCPPGVVHGFLILGLRSDALRYCDLLFSTDDRTLWKMAPPSNDDEDDDGDEVLLETQVQEPLQRRRIDVEVELSDGTIRAVRADTYVWARGIEELTKMWDEDRFVRCKSMQKLLSANPKWTEEEQQLADSMGTSLALVGDYLCSAIMAGDEVSLSGLLNANTGANSPCRLYGTPLQAAVVSAHEDMVRMLIAHGANVNASGGLYGTPLIAAVIHSRISITKILLHHGANVLKNDDAHVDALYQAVKRVNYALVEILLEHGAWLTKNWREITDAAETAESLDICKLLATYDVKARSREQRVYRRMIEDERRYHIGHRAYTNTRQEEDWATVKYSDVGLAVMRRLGTVVNMPYNWKGRRAVELTVAALDAGAPLELINLIREAIHPIKAILDILRESDEKHELDQFKPDRSAITYREGGHIGRHHYGKDRIYGYNNSHRREDNPAHILKVFDLLNLRPSQCPRPFRYVRRTSRSAI